MQRVTLHDIKDALFDGMSQLVDTGLLLDHRLSVTSCQFRAGPNDYSVFTLRAWWETSAGFSCVDRCAVSEMPVGRE